MPQQKDLKRLVRARMEKTGESYTAARLQLVKKSDLNYAELAGMSDASVKKATTRDWLEWVRLLDREGASSKPHREIAKLVSASGAPSWWAQMVTVGYERIRGLRDRTQQRGGGYEASKSRTFNVPVDKLFKAFANARQRNKWLSAKITVRSARPAKSMRITWPDGALVQVGFTKKGDAKSVVAVQHGKLADKGAVEATKKMWSSHFDELARFLG